MDENTKLLYDQYIGVGNTETPEQFIEAKSQMGDEAFSNYILSQIELKKKDDTQVTQENLFSEENVTDIPKSNAQNPQILGVPISSELDINNQQEQAIQSLQNQNFSELDVTSEPDSTASDSTTFNSGLPQQFYDELGKYHHYNPKTGVLSGKHTIVTEDEMNALFKRTDELEAKNKKISDYNQKLKNAEFLAGNLTEQEADKLFYEDKSVDDANKDQQIDQQKEKEEKRCTLLLL